MVIKSKDLACLQIQLTASKAEIRSAIAAVGNKRDEIEQFLQRKAKPHLVQLLHSNANVHPS
jgi:hypothetical protein